MKHIWVIVIRPLIPQPMVNKKAEDRDALTVAGHRRCWVEWVDSQLVKEEVGRSPQAEPKDRTWDPIMSCITPLPHHIPSFFLYFLSPSFCLTYLSFCWGAICSQNIENAIKTSADSSIIYLSEYIYVASAHMGRGGGQAKGSLRNLLFPPC